MTQRLDYRQSSPELFRKFSAFSQQVARSSIEPSIQDLVFLRASQINGCAFCVDMHVKQATIRGERPLRLHHVAIWRESTLFEPRERAALAWTEALTALSRDGVPDDVYERVREQFSEAEISDLAFAVMAINGWNRVNIAFRTLPGSADKDFGLDAAKLA
ncbi:MAG TPA: carboxymuconolactone decarboxylase family protein [Rhodanobacteraceae bacterium]|nr:carboxymuconolactone decarboxylase family protein [Rhodanobacteraceae bacterium]